MQGELSGAENYEEKILAGLNQQQKEAVLTTYRGKSKQRRDELRQEYLQDTNR